MPIEFESWRITTLQQMSEGITGASREFFMPRLISRLVKTRNIFEQLITEPIDLTVPEEKASLHDFLWQTWRQTQEAPTITACLQTGRTFRKLLGVRRFLESAGINSFEKLTVAPETAIKTVPLPTVIKEPLSSTRQAIIAILQQLADTNQGANLEKIGKQVGKTREWVRLIYDKTNKVLQEYHRENLLPPLYHVKGQKRQMLDTQVRELIRQGLTSQEIREQLSATVSSNGITASLKRLKATGETIPHLPRSNSINSIPNTVVAEVANLRREKRLGEKAIADILNRKVFQIRYIIGRLIAADPTLRLRPTRRNSQQIAQIDTGVANLKNRGKTYKQISAEMGISISNIVASVNRQNKAKLKQSSRE